MNNDSICRLCQKSKPLASSHIIPEFLYTSLYDDKHRFLAISTAQAKKAKLIQKGLREHLLCNDCEQHLSKWENYTKKLLDGDKPTAARREGNLWHLTGLDYKSFKLFQLSILWRASVSSQKFFRFIALGRHEETIRKLLISSNPGPVDQYGCVMCSLVSDKIVLADLVIQPDKIKLHGHTAYRFIFGGFMWTFFVSNHTPPAQLKSAFLAPPGNTTILVKNISDIGYIKQLANELVERGSLDNGAL